MNTSQDIRLKNLLRLASEFKFIKDFCAKVGILPAYFSQIKHGNKNLGGMVARQIEEALKLQKGYMDVPHDVLEGRQRESSSAEQIIMSLPEHLKDHVMSSALAMAMILDNKNFNRREDDTNYQEQDITKRRSSDKR